MDWFADTTLQALAEQRTPAPDALRLLLRRYVATGRTDLGAALEPALGQALGSINDRLDAAADRRPECEDDSVGWLMLIVEAASISEDHRLRESAARLASALRARWPSDGPIAVAMRSIEGCLVAASVAAPPVDGAGLVAASIDELERLAGLGYQPGERLPHIIGDSGRTPGTVSDHTTTASTLLTAYAITGRLPYSMLAEELLETARQIWWDREAGAFSLSNDGEFGPGRELELLVINCDAARVFCRLAALHADAGYREHAAFNRQVDYAGDAQSILAGLASTYRSHGLAAVGYGLAVEESLRQL
jgi:hypothetical protein